MMKRTDDEQELPPDETPGSPPDPNSPAELFYGGAIVRILHLTLIFGALGAVLAFAAYGVRAGLGFCIGAGLSYWNFRTLASSVNSLGERIVVGHSRETGGLIVVRFVSRILLVGLAGYAIFIGSPGSLKGFLVGLCMPVPALMWEAGYEGFAALRRGL
jgi:hypothetical protein